MMKIPNIKLSDSEMIICEILAGRVPEMEKKEAARRFLEAFEDKEILLLVQANELSSVVAHVLMDVCGVERVPVHLLQVHKETYLRISAYLDELDMIAGCLSAEGIDLVVLKNGGIARGIHPCPGCSPMGDLDVLVEKHHFRIAHKILLNHGYHFEFRSPLEDAELKSAEQGGGAEYWKILPGGEKLWFELQWRPVAGRWIRPDQEPDASDLMSSSVFIPGTDVKILSPENNLLQVALHTAKHTYVRAPGFRLHLDVLRIVQGQSINWDVFVKRVLELQVRTPVFFSLLIPKLFFKAPIPDEVIGLLKPQQWKVTLILKWLQKAGFFNPDEKKFSKIAYIIFTALLYDDLSGFWRSIFPDREYMTEKYNVRKKHNLFVLHCKRLNDLVFRRART